MITISNNGGGFGNQLFQYCFARLLAEENNINLRSNFTFKEVLDIKPHKEFKENEIKGNKIIDDNVYHNWRINHGSTIPKLDPSFDYTIAGYFQDAELFNNYEAQVRSFFNLPELELETDTILVTVRLGDFIHGGNNSEIIHYEWYNTILNQSKKNRLFLVCNRRCADVPSTFDQEQKYMQKIIKNNDEIIYTGPTEGLNLKEDLWMRFKYNNQICSNSTFSWWGSFLSKAKNIITFEEFGFFGPNIKKCHGIHINKLYNIRNVSKAIKGEFLDITQI